MRFASLCLALVLSGCTRERPAVNVDLTLEELAAGWSGARGDPVCQEGGPRGEVIGLPGSRYCQWPIVRQGDVWGRVTGNQEPRTGLVLVNWERVVRDSAQWRAVVDSLDTAFSAAGLQSYACPEQGRRWQREGLGVQLTALPPDQLKRPRIAVMATSIPAALPSLFCPEAPILPAVRAPRVTRTRSA